MAVGAKLGMAMQTSEPSTGGLRQWDHTKPHTRQKLSALGLPLWRVFHPREESPLGMRGRDSVQVTKLFCGNFYIHDAPDMVLVASPEDRPKESPTVSHAVPCAHLGHTALPSSVPPSLPYPYPNSISSTDSCS